MSKKQRSHIEQARSENQTEGVFYCRVEEPEGFVGPQDGCAEHSVGSTVVDGEWVWLCTVCKEIM